MATIYSSKKMRERDGFDHYPTPLEHSRAGVSLVPVTHRPEYILDPGAGTGVWGKACRERYPEAIICGTDIRPLPRPNVYDFWFSGGYNYLLNQEENIFDLVVGNPPYGQFEGKKDVLLAEKFCRISLRLLKFGGFLVFLLPITFIAGQKRALGLYNTNPLYYLCPSAERPSFTGDDKTDATEYSFYIWRKGYRGTSALHPAIFASQFSKPLPPLYVPKPKQFVLI